MAPRITHRLALEDNSIVSASNPLPITGNLQISTTNAIPVSITNTLPIPITATNTMPVSVTNTVPVTNNDFASAALNIYEKTMDTLSSFLALTLTSQTIGLTIASRANTTTLDSPQFDLAHTSTGTPFFRVSENFSYFEDGMALATNTILYFSVSSQTNSVIQVATREIT